MAWTKAEAIAQILEHSGHLAATGIVNANANSNYAVAERWLDRWDQKVQARGWDCQTEREVELTPDGSGFITVPSGTIWINSSGCDYGRDIVQRGNRLYDRKHSTYVFLSTETITCEYALRLEFECLPDHVANLIIMQAALSFNHERGAGDRRDRRRRALEEIRPDLREAEAHANSQEARMHNRQANVLLTNETLGFKGNRHRRGDGAYEERFA